MLMAQFFFDLKGGLPKRDHRGEICATTGEAKVRADAMADRYSRMQPDLVGRGYYVALIDITGREIYQAPVKPLVATR